MTTRGYGDRWWEETTPADLQKTNVDAAAAAAATPKDSYTKKITVKLVKNKQYKFWFKYKHEDPDTKEVKLSDSSPIWTESFAIPNLTKAVQNLTLTAGPQSYTVKFDIDPLSIQEDVVVFESLTSDFAVLKKVGDGTSTSFSVLTDGPNAFANRWIKVRSRDRWDDLNISEATAGPVKPFSVDVDTSTPPKAPVGVSVNAAIDTEDKSGFSIKMNVSWTASTDTNTNGYVIRWSPNNPATVTSPVWEYGQVDGKATNTFSITGLSPNTVYYWQVTAKSPFNAISWDTLVTGQVSSGSFGPISDPNAPDGNIQLRSILSIGGKTADLFKIGTGITQSINTSTTITPSLVSGTYNGIILDRSTTNFGHNYWLNTGQFRVGSSSSFLYWDGANIYTTGKINATGGSFTGDVQLASGTLYAGSEPNSGARVRLSNAGIFAYNSSSTNNGEIPGNTNGLTFALQQATGQIYAASGIVGGWTLATTGLSSGGSKIESSGNISLGNNPQSSLQSIVRLSADDPTYRLWIGSQVAEDAPFKVTKEGKLYATGAVFGGYATTAYADGIGTAAASDATAKANAAQSAAATDAQLRANAAQAAAIASAATDAQTRATNARDAAILASVAKTDFNKDEIIKKINNSTVSTSIDGGLITTGTLKAEAVVTNFISAFEIEASKIKVGTLTGHILQAGLTGTSYYLNTKQTKNGIEGLVVNAIGIEDSRTGGVSTHWYPYYSGTTANYDLGTISYPWNDGRFAGNLMVGYRSQDGVGTGSSAGATSGPRIRMYASGAIFANTLGVGSGTPNIRQESDGFLRYTSSSSSKYKNSIVNIDSVSSLDPYKLLDIPVRAFKYNNNYLNEGDQRFDTLIPGFIAEEVNEVYPIAVDFRGGEPETWATNYLVPSMLALIQDFAKRLDALEAK